MECTPSPLMKCEPFETSPADSVLSDPSGSFPSLFSASASTIASSGAPTPADSGLCGDVFNAETQVVDLERLDDQLYAAQLKTEAAPEKKTGKKRKSWGQVLPEPKTNLPPRKRAKTEDEKEQRRVERVLRNRRAAQSSRERKRLEVDALERRNRELEALLAKAQNDNLVLYTQLCQLQGKPAVLPAAGTPVTLSQQLFGSPNGHQATLSTNFLTPSPTPSATIDPVSLSPAIRPVSDKDADSIVGTYAKANFLSPVSIASESLDAARPAADGATDSAAAQPAPSTDTTQLSVGGGESGVVRAESVGASGRGDAVAGDFVAVPFVDGVYDVAPGDTNGFAESGYLDNTQAAAGQSTEYNGYVVDNEEPLPPLFAMASDFDINDFFDPDGLSSATGGDAARDPALRAAGELGSDHPCMTVDV